MFSKTFINTWESNLKSELLRLLNKEQISISGTVFIFRYTSLHLSRRVTNP